jgi:apolipoprotein N-acyltransferase
VIPHRLLARRPGLAAFALGLLSAAALPPLHLIPVLALSLPGLLALISARSTWRGAAMMGIWFGTGHHIAGLYWITEAILIEATTFWWLVPTGVPMLAAFLALFIALPCAATHLAPAPSRPYILAGGWVLSDIARQFLLSGFPWNPLGSVWAIPGMAGDIMLQPAAWIGIHGLTLATILLPLLPRRVAASLLAAWIALGTLRLAPNPAPATPLTVVLIQGNIAQEGKWERAKAFRIFEHYLALTRAARIAHPDTPLLPIWPETAVPFLVDADPDARAAIAEAAGGPAIVGALRFDAARRPYNSLMALDPGGHLIATYDKWHLVPFGEYQPGWFPLPIAFVRGDGFGRGPGPATWHLPGIPPLGLLICYESIFPGQIVAPDRPDWLALVTNDAWFGDSAGPRQHLAAARLRAVEEGLPLMRAANTGISAGFDGYGRELGRLAMNESGTLALALPGKLPPPPFARWGLAIPLLLAAAIIAAGLFINRQPRHAYK